MVGGQLSSDACAKLCLRGQRSTGPRRVDPRRAFRWRGSSVDEEAFLAGANLAAVRSVSGVWELLQFMAAEEGRLDTGASRACCADRAAPRMRRRPELTQGGIRSFSTPPWFRRAARGRGRAAALLADLDDRAFADRRPHGAQHGDGWHPRPDAARAGPPARRRTGWGRPARWTGTRRRPRPRG